MSSSMMAVMTRPKRAVMLDAGIGFIGVLARVLEFGVLPHSGGDLLGDQPSDSVVIHPLDATELLIELPQDRRQAFDFGLSVSPPRRGWYRSYRRVFVAKDQPAHLALSTR